MTDAERIAQLESALEASNNWARDRQFYPQPAADAARLATKQAAKARVVQAKQDLITNSKAARLEAIRRRKERTP